MDGILAILASIFLGSPSSRGWSFMFGRLLRLLGDGRLCLDVFTLARFQTICEISCDLKNFKKVIFHENEVVYASCSFFG